MNAETSEKTPQFSFPIPSYEDWLDVARQELEGADPAEKLTISKGNLEILPFYSAKKKENRNSLQLKPSPNPYLGARSWANMPKIVVINEAKANELALSYLNLGAEGILFDCQSIEINPTILLNNISLTDCSVSFLINQGTYQWLQEFQLFAERNFNKNEIRGCVFWRNIPESYADIAQRFELWPHFNSLGILIVPQEDAVNQIAQSLGKAAQLANALLLKDTDVKIILDQISFSLPVGTDFFLDIVKLKALRSLWYQVRGAYGITSTNPLHIHANSTVWIKDDFQPHGNMIKSTTSAMAAIAGGCDSLTVEPEDDNNDTMSRIARNVSSILREESHFSKVADPTAGSYYIDSLTDQLSEKAWTKFQLLMK